MIDITYLGSSVAEPIEESLLLERYTNFTFTGFVDKAKLYNDIVKKLNKLETTLDMDKLELELIITLAQHFQDDHEEKEEVLIRIDWLQRLYQAKDHMKTIDTMKIARQIRKLIAPVQTCKMKNQLIKELESLEQLLPEEEVVIAEPSNRQLLMEKAIEEVGELFINLGKAGREYVIADVMKEFGEQVNIDEVQKAAIALEKSVDDLAEIKNPTSFITLLEQLPLQSLSNLKSGIKERVAEKLIEKSGWNGLLSLDRRISQIVEGIKKEEREEYERKNAIRLPDGTVIATSLDERYRDK